MIVNPCTGKVNLYESGRASRAEGVKIADCLCTPNTRQHQEWCIGWLDEDWAIVGARPLRDEDFVSFVK